MVEEKIFYQDQYKRSFTTKLLKQGMDENNRHYVVLEKTAFYPNGGGQPHDRGTLNGIDVYNVEEIDGEIRHFVCGSLDVHNNIVGEIDWNRRFDHIQQHAGQHILSAAFENKYGYKTISFHLGTDICTIDLEIPHLSEEEAMQAELLANEIIVENRPIQTKWVTHEELGNYSLRKELSVSENIRLVIIPNYDDNGCGGTHPNSTAEVASIKILDWEKQKKHIRISFVCGNRLIKQMHEKQIVIKGLTNLLNAPQSEIYEVANRVLKHSKELEKTVADLKTELLQYEAKELIAHAPLIKEYKNVQFIFKNRLIGEVQQLARLITSIDKNSLVFFINEQMEKFQLVCSRGKEIDVNINQLLKEVLPLINGKGGGNESFAQGGGEKIVSAELLMDELVKGSFNRYSLVRHR